MFRSLSIIVVSIVVALACGVGQARGQARDAGMVLAAARAALGGDAALTAVKTVVATGRTRQIRGNNMVPIEFEILCQLPDACVRREEYPAQNVEPSTTGFRGDTLIQMAGARPAVGAAPTQARLAPGQPAPVQIVQQEFIRLLVGVLRTPRHNMSINGQVDYALTLDHSLRVGYTMSRFTQDNQGVGGYDEPERAFRTENQTYMARVQH